MLPADFQGTYITVREQGDVVVVTFTHSHLNDEENIEQLGRELYSLVDNYHCTKLVLSLEQVEFITSSVLGKLISLHRRLHRNAGNLVVCHLNDSVIDVMRTSRLINYFHIADDLDGALAEFI